jgi:hypothetical protein
MKNYRKKPVVIQAIQYTGNNIEEIWDTFGAGDIYGPVEDDPCAYIFTLEGKMRCNIGDYIIRGVRGEFYPCEKSIFEETYEEV